MILYILIMLFCALYSITISEDFRLLFVVFSLIESGVEIVVMIFYIGDKINDKRNT